MDSLYNSYETCLNYSNLDECIKYIQNKFLIRTTQRPNIKKQNNCFSKQSKISHHFPQASRNPQTRKFFLMSVVFFNTVSTTNLLLERCSGGGGVQFTFISAISSVISYQFRKVFLGTHQNIRI